MLELVFCLTPSLLHMSGFICVGGCTNPGSIANGVRSGDSFGPGEQVRYTCQMGYLLVGQATLTCQSDGSYDNPVPSCTCE